MYARTYLRRQAITSCARAYMTMDLSHPPEIWTVEDVRTFLEDNGFTGYVALFCDQHCIDGQALLLLTEQDLRQPPLSITVLGDVKRLWLAIYLLQTTGCVRRKGPALLIPRRDSGGMRTQPQNHHSISTPVMRPNPPLSPLRKDESVPDFVIARVESPDTPYKSFVKTVMAALYCTMALLVTSFVMVIVHDRVPDMKTYPPLPDLFLDNVPLIPWAFELCEMIACTLGFMWTMVVLFHEHRMILLRRMFSLTGTVFLLRCVTMLITSLSVPGVHLECAGKVYGDFYQKTTQAFRIWFGMGMSIRGVRTCGDYMFSGHTVALTLLNHFITEYTPDSWHVLHTFTWVLNLFGIFFILAAHEHYSIDVFVAFYISSRLFLYYHSMAYNARSLLCSDSRTRMWFPLFWFFESGGTVSRVRNEFGWPLPMFRFFTWVQTFTVKSEDNIEKLGQGKPFFFQKANGSPLAHGSNEVDDQCSSDISANKKKKRRKRVELPS